MEADDFWRDLATRSRAEINAACEAVGVATYYLGPYCRSSETERLAALREVIADLRRALNLDDPDTTPDIPQQNGRENR